MHGEVWGEGVIRPPPLPQAVEVVAASVPPAPEESLRDRMAAPQGVQILKKFNRKGGTEQEVPDVRLDDYYEAVTFLDLPRRSGSPPRRRSAVLDLSGRPKAGEWRRGES